MSTYYSAALTEEEVRLLEVSLNCLVTIQRGEKITPFAYLLIKEMLPIDKTIELLNRINNRM